MLITSAPEDAAHWIPSAISDVLPAPSPSSTRTGISCASGATPATPWPFPATAAAMPATWVPW